MAPKWRSFYARSRPGYAIWRHLENLAGRPNNSETNNSFIIINVRAVEQTNFYGNNVKMFGNNVHSYHLYGNKVRIFNS